MPKAKPFKGQNFAKFKRKCIRQGGLFVDSVFPPNRTSIFPSHPTDDGIIWKRPGDIVKEPKFFLDGASADDFSQGEVGNCWFVAACACLAEDRNLLKKVVPNAEAQEWAPNNKYAGIFHFKFWRCGEWIDVVIDDYLPTRNGQLIFLHSKNKSEFWSALLEKAYAKVFGSYEVLTGGKARDALVDMTGGVGECFSLKDFTNETQRMELFDNLEEAMENTSLISASIQATSASDMEAKLSCGLVKGHAYSVTAVRKIRLGTSLFSLFNREKIYMIRCRNPWGGVEWKGAWSDGSAEWRNVSEGQKKELDLTFDENGEFWMSFEDFYRYFTDVDICHMVNTSFFSLRKTWTEYQFPGEWRTPNRAGGCTNNPSFLDNSHYILDIPGDAEKLMVSLEQSDKRVDATKNNDVIGFTIMKCDINRKYRIHEKQETVLSGTYIASRSTFARAKLTMGRYCLIPTTFNPGAMGKYMLRVYGRGTFTAREAKLDIPKPPTCCGSPKRSGTTVNITKGEGLKVDDYYCVVKCDGKSFQTAVSDKSSSPEWNCTGTFYRKKAESNVTVELWDNNTLKDSFKGEVTLKSEDLSKRSGNMVVRYEMYGQGSDSTNKKTGFLWIRLKHSHNMAEL